MCIFYWCHEAAPVAKTVEWQLDWTTLAAENNELVSAAATSDSVTDGTQTQDELLKTGAIAVTGVAAGDIVSLRVF